MHNNYEIIAPAYNRFVYKHSLLGMLFITTLFVYIFIHHMLNKNCACVFTCDDKLGWNTTISWRFLKNNSCAGSCLVECVVLAEVSLGDAPVGRRNVIWSMARGAHVMFLRRSRRHTLLNSFYDSSLLTGESYRYIRSNYGLFNSLSD